MNSVFSRRRMLQAMGAAAVFSTSSKPSAVPAAKNFRMPSEGKGTPKICLGVRPVLDEAGMRQLNQIGVDYVLSGGFPGKKPTSAAGWSDSRPGA